MRDVGRRAVRSALTVVAVSTIVAACAGRADVTSVEANTAHDGDAGSASSGSLEWTACDRSGAAMADLDCATLQVPRDHDDPDGAMIEIAMARVEAGEPDERIGSLVLNPGGPGGSGIDFLTGASLLLPDDLLDRFDVVSFDPRGVGASSAIECDVSWDDRIDLLEEGDDAEWAALVDEAEAFGETCSPASNELASHVGTDAAARDLDLIRDALGDEQLTYIGFSYGTRLGADYAEQFPQRVRALVLDGAVTPTSDLAAVDRQQIAGFDRAFESFAAECDADPDCALQEVGPALEVYETLVDDIAAEGSYATGDPERELTPGELELAVLAALYSRETWPVLASAMAEAATDRDGALLQALADTYLGREPDGTYDNSQVANSAINCADDADRPPVDDVRAAAETTAAGSAYFDDLVRASTGCIGWPDALDPLTLGPADGAAPILVIGTTRDPATPYEWSEELADFLSSGVLYTVDADGHTAFLSIPCVEDVVVDYLVALDVPPTGSSCTDDGAGDLFLPPGESEIDLVLGLFACLRDNGLDIPEVTLTDLLADPSGEILAESLDPSDPAFVEAVLACQHLVDDL